MQSFRLINQEEIASLLDMDTILGAVEQAYADKCRGLAQLFPVVCHSFEDGVSEFDIKSGSLDGAGVFGMKLVSAFAGNSDLGLPRLTGTILVFDRRTGMLKSMMDGGLITNMRTGAAGAVGCKYLARPDSEDLLLVGTGAQGPGLLEATLELFVPLVMAAIIDVLDDIALEIADMKADQAELYDGLDAVSDDLEDVEDAVFGEDEEDDEDDEYEFEEPEEDEDCYATTCPTCEETIYFDESVLEDGEVICPNCGEKLEFDLNGLEEDEPKDEE